MTLCGKPCYDPDVAEIGIVRQVLPKLENGRT
jgi:hypothetical protein